MKIVLENFRVVDAEKDFAGSLVIEDGKIAEVAAAPDCGGAAAVINGAALVRGGFPVLMPAFVDLHAHFRDPVVYGEGYPFPSETLESAALAAAAGGFGTVVCMANTRPTLDTFEKAAAVRRRANETGLVDLYPALSLTKNLEGKELSEIALPERGSGGCVPLMFSEDGRDVADDGLFLAAMKAAGRTSVSCHCDFGGEEAEAAKKAGKERSVWSRIEENNAVRRVIALGKKAGCRIHIAHVSTKEAVETIRRAKAENTADNNGFVLTCEAMPHNFCLTEKDARKLGAESWGRVNPPLRGEEDRLALVAALADGTIDAIATDHAPHSEADKATGAPGFSGFETAFAAAYTELVRPAGSGIDLKRLSSLMSAVPARILGFGGGAEKRGLVSPGFRADLVIADIGAAWDADPLTFKTRGKNSPFAGRMLYGKIIMTFREGRPVYVRG